METIKAPESISVDPTNRSLAYYPLSSSQRRLFILYELEKKRTDYNLINAIEIKGEISKDIIKDIFQKIVIRHESLRTTFHYIEGEPVQTIHDPVEINVTEIELDKDKSTVDKIINNFNTPFDISELPLLRIGLINISKSKKVLFFITHHIVFDATSMSLVMHEFISMYKGKELPPLKVQYKDYAIWENLRQKKGDLKLHKKYWLEKFSGDLPLLDLPVDYPRNATQLGTSGNKISFVIDNQLYQKLQKICRENQSTLYTLLLAVYNVLLNKYSGQEDIIVGSPTSGRNYKGSLNSVGMFVNTLPLRNYPESEKCFTTFLLEVRNNVLEALSYQEYQYDDLVAELHLERNLSRNPLFDVMFNYKNSDFEVLNDTDITFRQHDFKQISMAVDLNLVVEQTREELKCRIEYSKALFSKVKIEKMIQHFLKIINTVVESPDIKIKDIDILSSGEKHLILNEFNNTKKEYPKNKSLIEIFEEQTEKTPQSLAIQINDQKLNYKQLNEKANQLAHFIINQGVKSDEIIAISIEPSIELIVSIFASLKVGAAYVYVDPYFPKERISYILNETKPGFLITKNIYKSVYDIYSDFSICFADETKEIEKEKISNIGKYKNHNYVQYIIFTSGSTGKPKGVMELSHGLLNRLHWMWETYPYNGQEVACQKTSYNFVDYTAEIFSPLLQGVPLIIFNEQERKDINLMVDLFVKHKITRIVVVPSLLKVILDLPQGQVNNLKCLKYVFSSGEELFHNLAKTFYQKLKSAKLVNIYGSSEVSADVTYYDINIWDVNDVVKYFKNNSLLQVNQSGAPEINSKEEKYFTTPDINLETLAGNFQSSELMEFPLELKDYYSILNEKLFPYVINTASPLFIGHMTSALPDFVHDLSKTISKLNQNLVKIETSKSLIFMEREAISIMHRQFYNYPEEFYSNHIQNANSHFGLITAGGSISNITALLVARNQKLGINSYPNASGNESIYELLKRNNYKDFVILGTRLMHYSIRKSASVMGLGVNNVRYVDTDSNGKLNVISLTSLIEKYKAERILVLAIVGIAGTTETGQIDPLYEIAEVASKNKIHFHVDAAWGGTTIFSEKYKYKLKGIEKADSIALCGHKQLYLPMGISICLFKDIHALNSIQVNASYQGVAGSFDTGQYTIEGSRSAISLTLHAALNLLGRKGYEALINNSIGMANYFSFLIKNIDSFELIGKPELNIVNYRYIPQEFRVKLRGKSLTIEDNNKINQVNTNLQKAQFIKGKTFVSKTTLYETIYGKGNELVVFRVVLSNPLTNTADIYTVLEDQLNLACELFNEKIELNFNDSFKEVANLTQDSEVDYSLISKVNHDNVQSVLQDKTKISIGKPISNTSIYILDKHFKPVPVGVIGEIHVGGVSLAKGYINNAGLTNEKFIDNPFQTGEKIYKTGDLGRWKPDGNIEYLGRIDNQVKIRGFRIELGEIENALLNHEDINSAIVIAKESKDGNKDLVAYFIAEKKIEVSWLKSYLVNLLPDFMVPGYFIQIESYPLTDSGKVDYKRLLQTDIVNTLSSKHFVLPRNPKEEEMVEIWKEILDVQSVGLTDNFFEIGGTSIRAINLVGRMNKIGLSISINDIFRHQTIKAIMDSQRNMDANINELKRNYNVKFEPSFYVYPYYFLCNNEILVESINYHLKMDIEKSFFPAANAYTYPGYISFFKPLTGYNYLEQMNSCLKRENYAGIKKFIVNSEHYSGFISKIKAELAENKIVPVFGSSYFLHYSPTYNDDSEFFIENHERFGSMHQYFVVDIMNNGDALIYDTTFNYYGVIKEEEFYKSVRGIMDIPLLKGHPSVNDILPFRYVHYDFSESDLNNFNREKLSKKILNDYLYNFYEIKNVEFEFSGKKEILYIGIEAIKKLVNDFQIREKLKITQDEIEKSLRDFPYWLTRTTAVYADFLTSLTNDFRAFEKAADLLNTITYKFSQLKFSGDFKNQVIELEQIIEDFYTIQKIIKDSLNKNWG